MAGEGQQGGGRADGGLSTGRGVGVVGDDAGGPGAVAPPAPAESEHDRLVREIFEAEEGILLARRELERNGGIRPRIALERSITHMRLAKAKLEAYRSEQELAHLERLTPGVERT